MDRQGYMLGPENGGASRTYAGETSSGIERTPAEVVRSIWANRYPITQKPRAKKKKASCFECEDNSSDDMSPSASKYPRRTPQSEIPSGSGSRIVHPDELAPRRPPEDDPELTSLCQACRHCYAWLPESSMNYHLTYQCIYRAGPSSCHPHPLPFHSDSQPKPPHPPQ